MASEFQRNIGFEFRFNSETSFFPHELHRLPALRNCRERVYVVEKLLPPGKRGFTYECNFVKGNKTTVSPKIVIKEPNISRNTQHRTSDSGERLSSIAASTLHEWEHIRKRLANCIHANPIFDADSNIDTRAGGISFKTAQLYISKGQTLENELNGTNLGRPFAQTFHGFESWLDWKRYALIIAEAIEEHHKRRVFHGDLHPGNIFISHSADPYASADGLLETEVNPYAILIDYAESFAEPSEDIRAQRNHIFRAPERENPLYVVTEAVDVYSFGKLLYYLATGDTSERAEIPRNLVGHARRGYIRDLLLTSNRSLMCQNPTVLDAIASSTAFDPSARPSIARVVSWLRNNTPTGGTLSSPTVTQERLRSLVKPYNSFFMPGGKLYSSTPERERQVFLDLIEQKICELDRLLQSVSEKQVILTGTRDELIDGMCALFGSLTLGDSWSALSTPDVWQDSALGLDGRYTSATIQAVIRGATIRRVFAISVEELGFEWTTKFAEFLKLSGLIPLQSLAESLEDACKRFNTLLSRGLANSTGPGIVYHDYYRDRLRLVLSSLDKCSSAYLSPQCLLDNTVENKGLYTAILPLATKDDVLRTRVENPVSLANLYSSDDQQNVWLLVMTEMRGRVMDSSQIPKPQLRGIRVYHSVFDKPKDKIINMNTLLQNSKPVARYLKQIVDCIIKADNFTYESLP